MNEMQKLLSSLTAMLLYIFMKVSVKAMKTIHFMERLIWIKTVG